MDGDDSLVIENSFRYQWLTDEIAKEKFFPDESVDRGLRAGTFLKQPLFFELLDLLD